RPSTSTCPAVGSTSRFTIFRVVVLPQPDGPTSTTTCPAGTVSDRSSTAGGPLAEYRFVTWRNSTSTPCRPSGMAGTVSEGYALVTRAILPTSGGVCRPKGRAECLGPDRSDRRGTARTSPPGPPPGADPSEPWLDADRPGPRSRGQRAPN